MKIKSNILCLTLLTLFCSQGNIISPLNSDSSLVGLNLEIEPPIGFGSIIPDKVYFIKTGNESDLQNGVILESNYIRNGTIYFQNAVPGIYYIIGGYRETYDPRSKITETYFTFLDDDAIRTTRFEVGSSKLIYIGKYSIRNSWHISAKNGISNYYRKLIIKEKTVIHPDRIYELSGKILSFSRDEKSKNDFNENTKIYFIHTQWEKLME